MIDWDLYDYDDWSDWQPGARERMMDECIRMLGDERDAHVSYHEDDIPRFVAALLAAGSEPDDPNHDAHAAWQARAAEVLMAKFGQHWWMREKQKDPQYRARARTIRATVQREQLTQFYTWICKERREPWTDTIVVESSTV